MTFLRRPHLRRRLGRCFSPATRFDWRLEMRIMTFVHTNVFPATTLHLGGHEDGIIMTYLEKQVDGKMVEY